LNRELAARLKAEGLDATIEIVNEAGGTVVVEREAPLAHAGT
jgi:hypothetical protein